MSQDSIVASRIAQVIKAEADAIRNIRITPAFIDAVYTMRECHGRIITTGIGKAGHIARKFAATLCSTATPAQFLHPAEAVHGDLGVVTGSDDMIVAFSTSGKSKEVLKMLDLARRIGIEQVIGITSHPDSGLREMSRIVIDMGVLEEPCPLGLTPSASIAVMLAISDGLALALMELKQVTIEDYGMRHHAGYLGEKTRNEGISSHAR